ncbi:MAG: hypothetical protein ACRC6I_18170 [Paracoccaceae bacterium]
MNKLMQWKAEVTPGNVVSWIISLVGIVTVVVWLQADVRELTKSGERMDRRVAKIEDRTEADRREIGEMKGDIKFIRQMLESRKP